MGYPGIWSNIIQGMFLGVFLDQINIGLIERVKQIAIPNVSGPRIINLKM